MKRPPLGSLPAMGAAVMSCSLAGSCTTTPLRDSAAGPTGTRPSYSAVMRIAQLDHGREARFAKCVPPSCPAITPKTLGQGDHALAPQRPSERIDSPEWSAASAGRRADIANPASEPAGRPKQPVQAPSSITEFAVTFASGSATLTTAARASIDQAVNGPGITRLAIRGRTDSSGPSHINQALASARSRAVEVYLRRAHPRIASLISTVDATGACCYVASNETPDGRARNRRVEIDMERRTDDP
jgi:outer membrane protein OmpA-like peptidoglycan-associated protein